MAEIYGLLGASILVVLMFSASRSRRITTARVKRSDDLRNLAEADLRESEELSELRAHCAFLEEQLRIMRKCAKESDSRKDQSQWEHPGSGPEGAQTPDDPPSSQELSARRILGLPLTGSLSARALRDAHKAAVERAHPDAGGSEAAFVEVIRAYEYLKS